jgi:hypothetical protein
MKRSEALTFAQAEILAAQAIIENLLSNYVRNGSPLSIALNNAAVALSNASCTVFDPTAIRPRVKSRGKPR